MLDSYAGIFLEKSWLVLPFRVISICETRSETAARVPIWKSLIVRNASQLSASRITEHISFDYGTTQRGINCPELVHQSRKEGDSPHHHMPERVVWTTEDCANASSVTNFRRNERMCSMNVYFQSAWVGCSGGTMNEIQAGLNLEASEIIKDRLKFEYRSSIPYSSKRDEHLFMLQVLIG